MDKLLGREIVEVDTLPSLEGLRFQKMEQWWDERNREIVAQQEFTLAHRGSQWLRHPNTNAASGMGVKTMTSYSSNTVRIGEYYFGEQPDAKSNEIWMRYRENPAIHGQTPYASVGPFSEDAKPQIRWWMFAGYVPAPGLCLLFPVKYVAGKEYTPKGCTVKWTYIGSIEVHSPRDFKTLYWFANQEGDARDFALGEMIPVEEQQ